MTKSKGTVQDVATLLDERRRYEGWLATLDSRRASTPNHVFDRVRADYLARLELVSERLATHKDALNDELTGLQTRLGLLDAEIQLRVDERAEVELRAAVGELSESEAEKALAASEKSLAKMRDEREELDTQQRRLAEFIAATDDRRRLAADAVQTEGRPPAPPTERAAPEPPSQDPPPRALRRTPFDELGFLQSVVAAADKEPRPSNAASPSGIWNDPAVGGGAAQPPIEVESEVELEEPPAVAPAADLSDQTRPAIESALEALPVVEAAPPLGDQPYAANVPSNTPIKLRASGQFESSKTLKCAECGALNYPTEWYCERCGAELAAL